MKSSFLSFCFVSALLAQSPAAVPVSAMPPAPPSSGVSPEVSAATVLGPEDLVSVRVADDDEIPSDKPYRIDSEGYLHLPVVGQIKAVGMTTRDLETDITEKLRRVIKDPHVTVALTESHSHPVSILGAVNSPGVHQIEGPRRLLEVISMAGGLRPDAGTTARLTRQTQWGNIPLPEARQDLSGKFSVADIDIDSLMRGKNPEQNILIRPEDVISITKADLVYVIGEVKKPGGFPILAHEKISILTALALAEGANSGAATKNARILRENSDGPNRIEIAVNLSKIMLGQAADVPLQPNDILLVPKNVGREVAIRAAEAAIGLGTGLVIFHR